MKILIIDDIRNPRNELIEGNKVTIARSSAEAFKALNISDGFDQIWFDHDLGGDDTTRPIVAFLEELSFNDNQYPVGECIVHSSNLVGVMWLHSGLVNAGYKVRVVDAAVWFEN